MTFSIEIRKNISMGMSERVGSHPIGPVVSAQEDVYIASDRTKIANNQFGLWIASENDMQTTIGIFSIGYFFFLI